LIFWPTNSSYGLEKNLQFFWRLKQYIHDVLVPCLWAKKFGGFSQGHRASSVGQNIKNHLIIPIKSLSSATEAGCFQRGYCINKIWQCKNNFQPSIFKTQNVPQIIHLDCWFVINHESTYTLAARIKDDTNFRRLRTKQSSVVLKFSFPNTTRHVIIQC